MGKTILFLVIALLSNLQKTPVFGVFGTDRVDNDIKGRAEDLPNAVEIFVTALFMFLYLLATLYIIYAGFLILTAAGDEEKVKKAKQTMLYAVLGILVIFLASAIVSFMTGIILFTI